jgi:hypothetical protein
MDIKQSDIDFDHLLKLRLAVARFGEMDMARWWNTNSLLGRHGKMAINRGFPKTHHFVQAKIVFAVARNRCDELHNPPDSINLWNLPAAIENRFEVVWQEWLDQMDAWIPFFDDLAQMAKDNLAEALKRLNLISPSQLESVEKMRRSAEGRAVQITQQQALSDDLITLLAAGFSKGEPGSPAIPYILKANIS